MNKEDKFRELYGDLLGEEYINGACLTYENSKKHLKYSKMAAKDEDYGFAVSHLILGAEELIKALVLICLYRNESFITNQEKEKLFANHAFKHLNIKELLVACTDLSIHEYESEGLYYNPESDSNKFRFAGFFLTKHLGTLPIDGEEIDQLSVLMDDSNNVKNKGFYVDFKRNWFIPEDIKLEDYNKYRSLIEKLRSFIEPVFTTSLDDNRIMHFIYNE